MSDTTLLTRAISTRAEAWNKLNELREVISKTEGDSFGTAEQRAEWDRIEAVITEATDVIEREKRAIDAETRLRAIDEDPRLNGAQTLPPELGATGDEAKDAERAKQYGRAFRSFLRYGISGVNPDERELLIRGKSAAETRAQSDGTNSAGGYLVPQDYWVRITEVMKAYGGLANVCNSITTSDGRLLPWPKNDDTSNTGRWLAENTQVTETDATFTQLNLSAWTASSDLILCSLQLLQDSAFDLDSWIPQRLGVRLGRLLATAYVNGSGSSQPTGIAGAVTLTITGATGSGGAFTYANLVDLTHKIDPAYRNAGAGARFLMSDSAVQTLLKITDSYGHPLWQPTISQNAPDFLLGYPMTIDQAVPAVALSAQSVLFGNFQSAYAIRNVTGGTMMRLTERYADYLQVGFFGFIRTDGKPDDTNAVAGFVGGAS